MPAGRPPLPVRARLYALLWGGKYCIALPLSSRRARAAWPATLGPGARDTLQPGPWDSGSAPEAFGVSGEAKASPSAAKRRSRRRGKAFAQRPARPPSAAAADRRSCVSGYPVDRGPRVGRRRARPTRRTPRAERLVCAHANRTPNLDTHASRRRPASPRGHRCDHGGCLRGAGWRLRRLVLDKLDAGDNHREHCSSRVVHQRNRPRQAPPPRDGRLPRGGAGRKGQDLRMHCDRSQRNASSRRHQNAFPRHRAEQQGLRHIRGEVGRARWAGLAAGGPACERLRSGSAAARSSPRESPSPGVKRGRRKARTATPPFSSRSGVEMPTGPYGRYLSG
jgi:hypothetical protein